MSCHNYTITQSCDMMGNSKGSRRNDVIQHVIHILTLRKTHSYLE